MLFRNLEGVFEGLTKVPQGPEKGFYRHGRGFGVEGSCVGFAVLGLIGWV